MLRSWIRSAKPPKPVVPELQWRYANNGVLVADHDACHFEVVEHKSGFLLLASGDEAGLLRVDAASEEEAQQIAEQLKRCWPRWMVTAAPVVDS